jgi:hypothetical protein
MKRSYALALSSAVLLLALSTPSYAQVIDRVSSVFLPLPTHHCTATAAFASCEARRCAGARFFLRPCAGLTRMSPLQDRSAQAFRTWSGRSMMVGSVAMRGLAVATLPTTRAAVRQVVNRVAARPVAARVVLAGTQETVVTPVATRAAMSAVVAALPEAAMSAGAAP